MRFPLRPDLGNGVKQIPQMTPGASASVSLRTRAAKPMPPAAVVLTRAEKRVTSPGAVVIRAAKPMARPAVVVIRAEEPGTASATLVIRAEKPMTRPAIIVIRTERRVIPTRGYRDSRGKTDDAPHVHHDSGRSTHVFHGGPNYLPLVHPEASRSTPRPR